MRHLITINEFAQKRILSVTIYSKFYLTKKDAYLKKLVRLWGRWTGINTIVMITTIGGKNKLRARIFTGDAKDFFHPALNLHLCIAYFFQADKI